MRNIYLTSLVASGLVLLAGCGGGSADAPMQSSNGGAGVAPVVPVVPPPPVAPPVTKPDFTDYLSTMVASTESDTPLATDDVEFVFADDEDDAAFAAVLLEM